MVNLNKKMKTQTLNKSFVKKYDDIIKEACNEASLEVSKILNYYREQGREMPCYEGTAFLLIHARNPEEKAFVKNLELHGIGGKPWHKTPYKWEISDRGCMGINWHYFENEYKKDVLPYGFSFVDLQMIAVEAWITVLERNGIACYYREVVR